MKLQDRVSQSCCSKTVKQGMEVATKDEENIEIAKSSAAPTTVVILTNCNLRG